MKIKTSYTSLFATIVLVASQFSFGMEKSVPLHIIPVGNGFSIQNIQLRDKTIDLLLLKENKPYLGQYNLESKSYTQKIEPINVDSKQIFSFTQFSYNSLPKQVGPYTLDYHKNSVHLFKKATQEQSKKLILFAGGENQQYKKSIENSDKNRAMLQKSESIKNMFADLGSIDNVNSEILLYNINSQVELDNLFTFMELAHENTIKNIETELNKLSIDQLCSLAKHSNYYDINCCCTTNNKDIRLTEIICKAISNKYIPIIDQACIKQLKFDLENMIARERVKDVIKYIDDHIAPVISFDVGKDVISVTFNPDGKRVVIGTLYKTAEIWDAQTGKYLRTLTGHTDSIYSGAVSLDGTRVITGSEDNTAKIWDAKTGQCLHTLTGHTRLVYSVAISSDGKIVVTVSWKDKTAKIWNAQTGECLHTLTGHTEMVTAIALSSDGKTIVTGSWDDTAKIWDTKTGKCLHTLTGHTCMVRSVAYSSDGERVVTVSDDNTAKIWDTKTGQCLHTLTNTGVVTLVTISSDGKTVVTVPADGAAKIWDAKTGQCLRTLTGRTDIIRSVAFSPDGKTVITGSLDGAVETWNIDDAAKKELLDNVTIEQADLLTEQVLPIIKTGKVFEPTQNSKEYNILMTISQKVRNYLK